MIKKQDFFLAIVLILILLVSACSSPGEVDESLENTAAPDTGLPVDDPTQVLPDTGGSLETELPDSPGGALGTALPTGGTGGTGGLSTAEPATDFPTEAADATRPETTPMETLGPGAGETPSGAETPEVAATDTMTGTQEQIWNAEILPETGRNEATLLSNLLGYELVGSDGGAWGTVSDYIVNWCEAHILYMVVDAGSAAGVEGGRMLVPYEVVTLQDGIIDVEQRTITVNLDASQLSGAPAYDDDLDLASLDWEGEVQSFWSGLGPINLTSECNVEAPATGEDSQGGAVTVNKIAYASELLGAELQTGNGDALGSVEDYVIEPESGQLMYALLQAGGGEGVVPVPIRALNIPDPGTGEGVHLILLVEQNILDSAPRYPSIEGSDGNWSGEALEYWRQYVPLDVGQ